MEVMLDIQEGAAAKRTLYGHEFERVAIVSGITSASSPQKLIDALYANGLPRIGDPYPGWPTALLRSQDVSMISPDAARIVLHYAETMSTDIIIRIGSQAYCAESNKDKNGNVITVQYKYPDNYLLDTELAGQTIKKSSMVQKEIGIIEISFSRSEIYPAIEILKKAENYTFRVNSEDWILGGKVFSKPYETMCTGIHAESQNGGFSYVVNYTFCKRDPILFRGSKTFEGITLCPFDVDVIFRDERTGEPPSDVKEYVAGSETGKEPWGINRGVKLYAEADFNELYLG